MLKLFAFIVASATCCSGNMPPIPVVNRTTDHIVLANQQGTMEFAGATVQADFYRNNAYGCGLSGVHTFMVLNPANKNAKEEAPLWIYLHGGGSGYYDEPCTLAGGCTYYTLSNQDEDTWNHEETFDKLTSIMTQRCIRNGQVVDQTLTRRYREGYRVVVVSMCDHDQYLGMGTPYPNNQKNPGAQVNGLQATMSAIDFSMTNYPTTDVFVHGTSAGSVGAYAVGLSYAAEGNKQLAGVIADSVLSSRGKTIQKILAGEPGFPQDEGYDPDVFDNKVGFWRAPKNRAGPEERIAAGFDAIPLLFIGGLVDPQCAGERLPLPDVLQDGFDNNCKWIAAELMDTIKAQPNSPHRVSQFSGEAHVPTIKAGAAHDVVDEFIIAARAASTKAPANGTTAAASTTAASTKAPANGTTATGTTEDPHHDVSESSHLRATFGVVAVGLLFLPETFKMHQSNVWK